MQITYSTEHFFLYFFNFDLKTIAKILLHWYFIIWYLLLKSWNMMCSHEDLNNINTSSIFCYIYISSENLVSQQQYKRRLAVDMWCEKYDLQNKTIRWFRAPFNKQTLLRNSQIITKSFPPNRFAYALCMH